MKMDTRKTDTEDKINATLEGDMSAGRRSTLLFPLEATAS